MNELSFTPKVMDVIISNYYWQTFGDSIDIKTPVVSKQMNCMKRSKCGCIQLSLTAII